ncbi:lytic murein transglycosylase [Marinovum sp. 2_MG-2023]|uniref:lytic murein transglycosylase n=1 Tax=unclassified Marinovum TaxID=2647166 RepID=UPI0026E3DF44|nr:MULTISPECIES: lytic murein transglycosylase [unclassified Marinovum]MDO6732335.1 lytic murein transglycosylase [Marinovum sp. 2_MG-2023]MDO6781652.1 lytic murein transglycosylase [Marinovum sp. 1_MG-2023]
MLLKLLVSLGITAAVALPVFALESSPRPGMRPGQAVDTAVQIAMLTGPSLRPQLRPSDLAGAARAADPVVKVNNPGFQSWVRSFRPRALAAGVSGATYDRAFRGVTYNSHVIERDRRQTEFTKTVWEYLDIAASDKRIRDGKRAYRRNSRTLDRIEAHYGVDKHVVAAIWGLESAYGETRGDIPVIEALATLAYDGRRGRFFEKQLIEALRILQRGDTTPANMTGSWAGAMGHTQFIPTSFAAYAVDFTGDGKRDIWSNDPTDALASTAAYLARFGWARGMPWGVEVKLPRGFDYGQVKSKTRRMPSDWARAGVVGMDGRPVRDYGSAYLMLPAGSRGAAFLIFKNFDVIKRYNNSDLYAMGVGHLSDRITGGPAIQGGWPIGDRALNRAERMELQRRLTQKGFDTKGVDGQVGPATIAALRAYQNSIGEVPDGNASFYILKKLR